MKKNSLMPALVSLLLASAWAGAAEDRILVYTRNGKGFVHDNIRASVEAINRIGQQRGWKVDVSTNPAVFSDGDLKKYRVLVFCNSNNEALDTEEQRNAFQRYIRAGGGFAGVHSATGSERKWPWYWALIGGTFAWHQPLQPFTVRVVDTNHPSTFFFQNPEWQWEDEFYYVKERNAAVRVLLAGDQRTLKKPGKKKFEEVMGEPGLYPLAWCHEFEGGRAWYTALGHKPQHYSDPFFVKHLEGGIAWAMGVDGHGEKRGGKQ